MPFLKTVERIFIGSSMGEATQRESAIALVKRMSARLVQRDLELEVFDYRRLVLDGGHLQQGINRWIAVCDLAVLLFGERVGEGLREEAALTLDLVKRGVVPKLLPYVLLGSGSAHEEARATREFLDELREACDANQIMRYEVTVDDFEAMLQEHLDRWFAEEREVVARQRDFLKRDLLRRFAIDEITLSHEVMSAYHFRSYAQIAAQSGLSYARYSARGAASWSPDPTAEYLIARFLLNELENGRSEAFAQDEFIHSIHQHVTALVVRETPAKRARLVSTLEVWLVATMTLTAHVRTFAAFQLGMLRSHGSSGKLLGVLQNQSELESVRFYAAHALGMLRQRGMISKMIECHDRETNGAIREALSSAILYVMGIVN